MKKTIIRLWDSTYGENKVAEFERDISYTSTNRVVQYDGKFYANYYPSPLADHTNYVLTACEVLETVIESGTYVTTTEQTFELNEQGYFTICGIRQGVLTGEKGYDRDEVEMWAIEGLKGIYYVPNHQGLVRVTNPPLSVQRLIESVKAANGSRSDA